MQRWLLQRYHKVTFLIAAPYLCAFHWTRFTGFVGGKQNRDFVLITTLVTADWLGSWPIICWKVKSLLSLNGVSEVLLFPLHRAHRHSLSLTKDKCATVFGDLGELTILKCHTLFSCKQKLCLCSVFLTRACCLCPGILTNADKVSFHINDLQSLFFCGAGVLN